MGNYNYQPNTIMQAQKGDNPWSCGCLAVVVIVIILAAVLSGILAKIADAQSCADAWEPDDPPTRLVSSIIMERHTFDTPGDKDGVLIPLSSGQTVTATTYHLTGGADTLLYLYNSSGEMVSWSDDCNYPDPSSCLQYTAPLASIYRLRVSDFNGNYGCDTGYSLSVRSVFHAWFPWSPMEGPREPPQ